MIFFLLFSIICFGYTVYCDIQLKKYKFAMIKNVKLVSYNKYKSIARGSTIRNNRITWYSLTVELPLDIVQEDIETTISTTNPKAKKYKNSDYIDIYIIHHKDSQLIESIHIKEDLKTPVEKYFSLIMGSVSLGIFIICVYLPLI